ncbi:MAG: methyltransferase domain-containing protein [Bdellovibrionota bacterium]
MEKLIQISIKPGQDKKFRQGQPWVFDYDISETPRELRDGSLVEIRTSKSEFIGRGYWNSQSKINARIVSFDSRENDLLEGGFFVRRLQACWGRRKQDGFDGSFRLCFGEGDYLPGVVIDYYLCRQKDLQFQTFVIQTTTLGIDRAFQRGNFGWENIIKLLLEEGLPQALPLDKTCVVLRNDVGARKYEGLEEEQPRMVHGPREVDITKTEIAINDLSGQGNAKELVWLKADLLNGQKTGFFLDQTRNIQRLLTYLKGRPRSEGKVRVLDLCCYLGHWSTQLAHYFKAAGVDAEFHLVDVSEKALEMAEANVVQFGFSVIKLKRDVLKDMDDFQNDSFDIVICDPPAFIKSKKDLPQGQHAYTKLNRRACDLTKPNGLMVSCSCSGLLTMELFKQVLIKAQESFVPRWRLVEEGGLPPDHPRHLGFSEGAYLKMFLFEKN